MYYLRKTEKYGVLEIISEYLRYDVPRAFIAGNKKNEKVFIYWTDEFEDADGWYYVTISDEEIKNIEHGHVQLRDLFLFKDVLWVRTPYDIDKKIEEIKLPTENIDHESLPPEGFAVSILNDGCFALAKKELSLFKTDKNYHEIKIYKPNSHKEISWNAAQPILNAWGNICEYIIDSFKFEKSFFSPACARPGSYKMQFKASHNIELINTINLVANSLKNQENSTEKIKAIGVDPVLIENLMSALREHELIFDIRTNTGGLVNTINYKKLDTASKSLSEFTQQYISSEFIPQADEISRIITLVKNKLNGEPFNGETEKITHRQISYYLTAAKILGFITNFGVLTPIGHRLAEEQDVKLQYKILVERFETSLCGWAWMKYCDVKAIYDINENTAKDFLLKHSIGLSEATAQRRAITLKGWIVKFKENR